MTLTVGRCGYRLLAHDETLTTWVGTPEHKERSRGPDEPRAPAGRSVMIEKKVHARSPLKISQDRNQRTYRINHLLCNCPYRNAREI